MSNIYRNLAIALFLGAATAYNIFLRNRYERVYNPMQNSPRYFLVSGILFFNVFSLYIIYFVSDIGLYSVLNIANIRAQDRSFQSRFIYDLFIPNCIVVTLYCAIMLSLLPLFRRKLHSRTCIILWLHLFSLIYLSSRIRSKTFIMTLPVHFTIKNPTLILLLWAGGFIGIIGYYTISHLLFRHKILKNAKHLHYDAVDNSDQIGQIFGEERRQMNLYDLNCPIYISDAVSTPLTIGLSNKTLCIVLPHANYDDQAISLLFRHELIHISRKDYAAKLSMAIVTALFWFNPLVWIGKQQCADDLELSCDETVLVGQDIPVRKDYADLLLKTAADGRGFTTCLSGSARALRYRLKNVMANHGKSIGGILAGVFTCVITFLILSVGIGYAPQTTGNMFESELADTHYEIYEVMVRNNSQEFYYDTSDVQTIETILSHPVYRVVGKAETDTPDTIITIKVRTDTGSLYIRIYEHFIYVSRSDRIEHTYYTPEIINVDDFGLITETYMFVTAP